MKKIKVSAFFNAFFGGIFAGKSKKAFQWSNPQEDEFFYGPAAEQPRGVDIFFLSHSDF